MWRDVPEDTLSFPLNVFVYGTLKKGMSNHGVLSRHNARFIGEAEITGLILHLGGFPGLIDCMGTPKVQGEVWEIQSREALSDLDALEGHPHHYKRVSVWATLWPNLTYQEKAKLPGLRDGWVITYGYQRYEESRPHRICWPPKWTGAGTNTRLFLGFYAENAPNNPKKTETEALFHYRYNHTGWSGLVWAHTGEPVVDSPHGMPKPHFKYNHTLAVWELQQRSYYSGYQGPQSSVPSTPPIQYVEFKDDYDPGEEDAAEREVA